MKITIDAQDYIFGEVKKGKQWAKLITSVDDTKQNGFAFEGNFLKKEGEMQVDVGGVILSVGFKGSWNNGCLWGRVYQVTSSGLKKIYEDYYANIISIREEVSKSIKINRLPSISVSELKEQINSLIEKVVLSGEVSDKDTAEIVQLSEQIMEKLNKSF